MAGKQQLKEGDRPEKGEKFDLAKYLSETREELSKVVWPSRRQLVSESVAVIFTVSFVAALIYLFDNLFIWITERVFG